MLKALVTGATGVIGAALVRRLLIAGVEVFAVSRPKSKHLKNLPQNELLHVVECDLRELSSLSKLINQKCEMFFHLGWLGTDNRTNRFDMYLQNENVRCALDAVEVAKALGAEVFVGAGSQAEYGRVADGILRPDTESNPVSGYGMAKLCAGQMTRSLCQQAGIRHVWPRILSIYGLNENRDSLIVAAIQTLLAGKEFSMTAGDQDWDYLYADDAADAFYQMALRGKDGAIYPLGSGRTHKLREYVECIRDAVNPRLKLGFGDIPYLPDQVMHMKADISMLTADTGWQPQTKFAEGVVAMLAVMK